MDSYIINQAGEIPEILLFGYIGNYEQNNSKSFVSDFKKLEAKHPVINVRINSGGGSVFDGIAIYNALKNSTSEIHIFIDGLCASIASVVAMAGKKISMSKHSQFMAHRVTGGVSGDAEQIVEMANLMIQLENSLVDIYSSRTGIAKEEIKNNWMQTGKQKYFTAMEALELKLVDSIYDFQNKSEKNLAIYNQTKKMENLNEFISFFNLQENASVQDILGNIQNQANEISNLKNQIEVLEKENADFKNQIEIENKNKITSLIDSAVKEKRITENQRSIYASLAESNFSATKSALEGIKAYVPISVQLSNSNVQIDDMTFQDYQKKNPKALLEMK
ncbi:MAG: head maturation protease, ClpP-related, partial [Bacteroidota bacterium]